ncbi:MAG: MGMT family protein [Planctomycetota bacterium]|nr:MGMT family protein [Planctomycetota bacterium]
MSATFERVYAVVRQIPHGRVATYGRVAELADVATPRVVGFALSALEDDTDVPWHRVLNAKGTISLGRRDGAATTQRERLEAEGVVFDANSRIDLSAHAWSGPA